MAAQKRLKLEPSSTQLNNSPLFSSEWDREIEADVKVGRLDAAGKRADRFRSWTLHPTLKHFASPEFWFHYRQLPEKVRDLADKNFALLKADPRHPSLRFKKVGIFWSARIGLRYRALA